MVLRQLEYLVALARERHFGRAAAACYVSQPALSEGLRRLEDELGVPLVRRERSYAGLTPEGERVVAWALQILADCDGLRDDLAALRGALTGRLRLGAIPTTLPIASALTSTLCAEHPQLSVTVQSLSSIEIERRLHAFELDAGITYLDNEPLAGVRTQPLAPERYVLVTAGGGTDPVRWSEAATRPLCLLTPDMQNRRILDAAFARAGAHATPQVEADSVPVLFGHVRTGRWATILPATWLDGDDATGLAAAPLVEPAIEQRVGVVVLDRDPVSSATRALLDAARAISRDT